MWEMKNACKSLVGELQRRHHMKEDDTKLDLRQYVLGTWIGFIWLRMGVGGGFL
jgi:hypothetical protein